MDPALVFFLLAVLCVFLMGVRMKLDRARAQRAAMREPWESQ